MDASDPLFREQFVAAIHDAQDVVVAFALSHGFEATAILANAIDDYSGCHSEILLHQHDLENDLMKRHNLFIPNIFRRARVTGAYQEMCFSLLEVISEYLPDIVDEVVKQYHLDSEDSD